MIRALVLRVPLFVALWWVLAEGRNDGWALGGVAVAVATWTSLRLLPRGDLGVRLAVLPLFLVFFLRNSIRGGMQVAGMALRGRAALRPALVVLPLALPPGASRILLANTLSLMPGSLVVDMDDRRIRLHMLDSRIVSEARALEAIIARLFGGAA